MLYNACQMLPYNKDNLQFGMMTNTVADAVHVKQGPWLPRVSAHTGNIFVRLVVYLNSSKEKVYLMPAGC